MHPPTHRTWDVKIPSQKLTWTCTELKHEVLRFTFDKTDTTLDQHCMMSENSCTRDCKFQVCVWILKHRLCKSLRQHHIDKRDLGTFQITLHHSSVKGSSHLKMVSEKHKVSEKHRSMENTSVIDKCLPHIIDQRLPTHVLPTWD